MQDKHKPVEIDFSLNTSKSICVFMLTVYITEIVAHAHSGPHHSLWIFNAFEIVCSVQDNLEHILWSYVTYPFGLQIFKTCDNAL